MMSSDMTPCVSANVSLSHRLRDHLSVGANGTRGNGLENNVIGFIAHADLGVI